MDPYYSEYQLCTKNNAKVLRSRLHIIYYRNPYITSKKVYKRIWDLKMTNQIAVFVITRYKALKLASEVV